ncbi:unnamed protein product [Hydatigera taeniaeformis]|uniref:C2 domain-containing protein n=1 Tax=Hydatigena taeniaeformis TaxID=6205 RepID=A0A0R3X6J9_HYDTA|nr:unnamed protein product [Hydatigera taeniaeformis]
MVNTLTTVVLVICIALATIAAFICAATLAVASPWWPQRKRTRRGHASGKMSTSPVNLLRRAIEAFSLTSPQTIPRTRDTSRRSSIFAESQSIPLRGHPERKRTLSSTAATPIATPPLPQYSPAPRFTTAEAPGGTINYRVFIDATGKDNLTVRVHLYYATNLPAIKPWKNSNYIVKAALIGFKSHFVQTSGVVTAVCGSPRFSEGHPSVLDFVLDCGMPFNKSEEEVQLRLMIIEFSGRKPGEKALLVATKEYRFSHHTLRGKSTLSTDLSWERCKPCIDVSSASSQYKENSFYFCS